MRRSSARAKGWWICCLTSLVLLGLPVSVRAESTPAARRGDYLSSINNFALPKGAPLDMEAKELNVHKKGPNDLVTAKGDVVIRYGPYTIITQAVSLTKQTQWIEIDEHVLLLDNQGNIGSAEYAHFSPLNSQGFFKKINFYTSQAATITVGTLSVNDSDMVVRDVTFTTCAICSLTANPLWHVKAKEVVRDSKSKTITYHHVFLYVKKVPVFYFPYFQQYDSSVKRVSGFLTPYFSRSQILGESISLPYYWNIAPNSDATIVPIFYTRNYPLLRGEFRHLLNHGNYIINLGVTKTSQQIVDTPTNLWIRGFLFSNGIYHLKDNWNSSFQVNLATDSTFLTRYDIASDKSVLINNLHFDHVQEHEQLWLDAFSFQSLQYPSNSTSSAIVAPKVAYHHDWEIPNLPGHFAWDMGTVSLARSNGVNSRRLSGQGSWEKNISLPLGNMVKLLSTIRGDLYAITYAGEPLKPNENTNVWTGRLLPTLGVEWRYPVYMSGLNFYHVLEPIVQVFASPKYHYPEHGYIPNEDSLNIELDDTNLFTPSRFPGVDRIEDGVRTNYGLFYTAYNSKGYQGSILLGQSYHITDNDGVFPAYSGLSQNLSDFVGHLSFSTDHFYIFKNFRLSHDNLHIQRYEIGLGVTYNPVDLSLSYGYFVGERKALNLPERSEITASGSFALLKNWRIGGGVTYDFIARKIISSSMGVVFKNECLNIEFLVSNLNIRRLDIQPDTTYLLKINLIGINA